MALLNSTFDAPHTAPRTSRLAPSVESRPVYKSLHRPLTIWGVDRRLFFMALLMGAAMFNLFYSFLAGLLMFVGLYGVAVWVTTRDRQMLAVLFASTRFRRRYDPLKHVPFEIEVRGW
jgi:type IV secretory pathway VirB3-like protein